MADTISAVKELTHESDSKVTVQSPIRKDNTVCNFRDFVEFSSETLGEKPCCFTGKAENHFV